MLQNTFSFEIGFYWIKLICSLHKSMVDLHSICVKPSITKCKKLYEDCWSLSTSSFEAVANSLQGKEWKEDRISIFNIAYSFLPQLSIQHRKLQSSLPVSLPQAQEMIKILIGLMAKVTLRKIFFELIFTKFQFKKITLISCITDLFFSFPLFYWIFSVDRQNLLLFCLQKLAIAHSKNQLHMNVFVYLHVATGPTPAILFSLFCGFYNYLEVEKLSHGWHILRQ